MNYSLEYKILFFFFTNIDLTEHFALRWKSMPNLIKFIRKIGLTMLIFQLAQSFNSWVFVYSDWDANIKMCGTIFKNTSN